MGRQILPLGLLGFVVAGLCLGAMPWLSPSFAQRASDKSTLKDAGEPPLQQGDSARTDLIPLLAEDPERAAEEFTSKTSDEVKEAIQILSKEAEGLRTRLQKVNGALRHLQAVLHALDTLESPNPIPMVHPVPHPAIYKSGS